MHPVSLTATAVLLLAAAVAPASARTRHHHQAMAQNSRPSQARAAPASHASIPQSANIENLNDISLRRARAGQNTAQPLAPALAQ